MSIANVALANTFNEFRLTFNEAAAVINYLDTAVGTLGAISTELTTGTINANTISADVSLQANNLTEGRIIIVGSDSIITDDAGLVYDASSNTIYIHEAVLNSVYANNITEGRVLIAGPSGIVTDDAGLIFNALTNTLYPSIVIANSLTANNLTQGRVAVVGTDGLIGDNAGLTFDTAQQDLTIGNDINVGGDADVTGNVSAEIFNANSYVDFNPSASAPAWAEGRVFYDATNKTLALYNNESDVTLQIGQEEWIRVYNNYIDVIENGEAVFIEGSYNGVPAVNLADASNSAAYHAVGVATHQIVFGGYGYVTTAGIVRGLDTSAFANGEDIYLSATTPGAFTNVDPSYPNFPVSIGTVIISDASEGSILVHPSTETVKNFVVRNDATIAGDLTIEGGLTVLGTQNVVSINNLEIENTFLYLGAGDSITANSFYVTGLNDMTFKGHFEGNTSATFYVKIDGTSPDTFAWSLDNFSSSEETGVSIVPGVEYELQDGISVLFNANTGHTLNDLWFGAGVPINVDLGVIGNYNEGSQYAHTGFYRDASDGIYKFFQGYYPEIESSIDPNNETFEYAAIHVANVTGTNVTASGNAAITGFATIGTTLGVTGATTLSSTAAIEGALTANGTSQFNSSVALNGVTNIKTHTVTHSALGTISGTGTINLQNATYFSATSGGTTTWVFSNAPDSSKAAAFVLELENGGTYTQNWPASVKWPAGQAPTLSIGVGLVDVLIFVTDDGGTTWRGSAAMIDSR